MCESMVKGGTFFRQNKKNFLCRSRPADVASAEKQTFISTSSKASFHKMQRMFPSRATLTTGTLCISLRSTVCGLLAVGIKARDCQARSAMPCVLHQP